MINLKHVGRVKNTGRKCVVVFREIYDNNGNVIEDNNCLVIETESLPDAEHQTLMRIIESQEAQSAPEIYNLLSRERHPEGNPFLMWAHSANRLRKYGTDNIEMTPNSSTVLPLNKLNEIIRMQNTGVAEKSINDRFNVTDAENEVMTVPANDPGVLTDEDMAENFLKQARTFEQQARELRKQAKEITKTETVSESEEVVSESNGDS